MSDLGLSKNWWGAILGVSMIRIMVVSQKTVVPFWDSHNKDYSHYRLWGLYWGPRI